ncbi:MAG: Crp/Fnr family transcriptional regulator [Kiritimatiellae bacterium]|nr:Crp/Fnr family transcriptional regulator [Kiritimatiellia bacterium]
MNLTALASATEFFRGFDPDEVEDLLFRLNGVGKSYRRDEIVIHAGLEARRIMVVASGRLHVYEDTLEGQSIIVREIGPGEALGLWIAHMPEKMCWPGDVVVADEPCEIISLDMAAARRLMASIEPRVARLAVNMSRILARELFTTWRKLMVMDEQSIEARVQMYLSELDNETGRTGSVVVPFNREHMAQYFGVSRPGLSRVLGQLRDRGLLTWRKNVFKIKF